MKPYLAYKDSGIEWLAEIPAHWNVFSVRRIIKSHKQGFYSKEEYTTDGFKLLRITDIDDNSNIFLSGCPKLSVSQKDYEDFRLIPNDFVFARSGTIGRFGIFRDVNEKVMFASYLIRFRFNESVHIDFLKFYFLSKIFKEGLISELHGGANKNVHAENIKDQIICLPSLEEQHDIAAYLDHKTRLIDTYVAKKQQQIERLHAYRTALINQAVTKGLNSDVPMKDSGIEWLGEIPAHWETLQIKRILERNDYGISASLSGDGKFKVLTMGHIQNGEVILPDKGCVDDVPDELILEKKDLLFNRTNSWDLVGKVGIFRGNREDNISFASYLVRFRMNVKAFPVYIHYLLNSVLVLSKARSLALVSINQANLNPTKYGQMRICLPPLEEQKKIAIYLDQQTAKIDALISKTQHQIDRLQAYRTSLISDVVTGKIDVRMDNYTDYT